MPGEPIIDCHVHPDPVDLPSGLLAEGARLGVTQFIVAALGRTWEYEPSHAHCVQGNRDALALMERHRGMVLGWAYVNPRFGDEAEAEIRWCVEEAGFVGIKLWVAALASERCVARVIDLSVELRVPVLMHAWHKATGNLPFESTPGMVADLARAKPGARIIMAHMGGDWQLGTRAAQASPALVDTSGSIVENGMVEEAVARLGSDRVLFGSDATGVDLATALAKVEAAEITHAARRRILHDNIRELRDWRGPSA